MLGLAIYNDVRLDFRFPQAIYRKLTGKHVGFKDLKEARCPSVPSMCFIPCSMQVSMPPQVNPGLHRGLRQLLEMDPSEVDALGLVFQARNQNN